MGKSIINAYTYGLIHTKKAINLDYDELPVDSPERKRLPLLLRHAWYNLNKTFRRRISHAGATPGQFTVLRTLHEGDAAGLTQSKLTRAMSSAPTPSPHCLSTWKRAGGLSVGRMKLTGAPTVSC